MSRNSFRTSRQTHTLATSWLVFAFALAAPFHPSFAQEGEVVASQGGASVTLEEIDEFAQGIPAEKRNGFFNNPQRIQSVLMNLLLQKQLANAAREHGLDKNPEFAAPLGKPTDAALAAAEVKRFRESLPVPDVAQLAKEEYQAHREDYKTAEQRDVLHLHVSTMSRSADEAKTRAEELHARAIKTPDAFDALVMEASDSGTKEQDKGLVHIGDGLIRSSTLVIAARALGKVGEISPVIADDNGYHVLKLVSLEAPRERSFEEVRERIMAQVKAKYEEDAVNRRTDTLRNLPIDANPELVASLRTRYAKTADAAATNPPEG